MTERVEWKGRVAFAEFAEALGVPTDQIMAAKLIPEDDPHEVFVLFTRSPEYPPMVWSVTLYRTTSGVFEMAGAPVKRPGMWEELVKNIEAKP